MRLDKIRIANWKKKKKMQKYIPLQKDWSPGRVWGRKCEIRCPRKEERFE